MNNKNCRIKERLYFTATPRYYKGKNDQCISMNNEAVYGKIIYKYSFKEAIKNEYILDFQIVTYTVPPKFSDIVQEKYINNDGISVNANEIISAFQLVLHIKNNKSRRKILTYHNLIRNAVKFKKTLNYAFDKLNIKNVNIFSMSGSMSMARREEVFHEFKQSEIGIICSAKVLNEGVDIQCVDTVMFVDPRSSTIDVTQCVGRAMRKYKAKPNFLLLTVL